MKKKANQVQEKKAAKAVAAQRDASRVDFRDETGGVTDEREELLKLDRYISRVEKAHAEERESLNNIITTLVAI